MKARTGVQSQNPFDPSLPEKNSFPTSKIAPPYLPLTYDSASKSVYN